MPPELSVVLFADDNAFMRSDFRLIDEHFCTLGAAQVAAMN